MNRPGRHKDAIAGLRREICEVLRDRCVRDRLPQTVCRRARLEARVDSAFGIRLQHHPGFGLAGFTRRYIAGLLVRRMYLDRERAAYIEELQQQREAAEAPG